MKRLSILIAALAMTSHVSAENIFNKLFKIKTHDYAKDNPGIDRMDVGDSGFYFYKVNRAPPSRQQDARPRMIPVRVVEESSKKREELGLDPTPHPPVISKNVETEERGYKAEQTEKKVIYGEGSSLRNDDVTGAWSNYNRKKKELDDHRREMERLRQARLNKRDAKKEDIKD